MAARIEEKQNVLGFSYPEITLQRRLTFRLLIVLSKVPPPPVSYQEKERLLDGSAILEATWKRSPTAVGAAADYPSTSPWLLWGKTVEK